jgi:hypothetical protein
MPWLQEHSHTPYHEPLPHDLQPAILFSAFLFIWYLQTCLVLQSCLQLTCFPIKILQRLLVSSGVLHNPLRWAVVSKKILQTLINSQIWKLTLKDMNFSYTCCAVSIALFYTEWPRFVHFTQDTRKKTLTYCCLRCLQDKGTSWSHRINVNC